MLKAYGMNGSMSRKDYGWDNAPTKSWFNSFKNEQVHGLRDAIRAEMTARASKTLRCSTTGRDGTRPGLQVTDTVSG
jgi:transposase InsO family protein